MGHFLTPRLIPFEDPSDDTDVAMQSIGAMPMAPISTPRISSYPSGLPTPLNVRFDVIVGVSFVLLLIARVQPQASPRNGNGLLAPNSPNGGNQGQWHEFLKFLQSPSPRVSDSLPSPSHRRSPRFATNPPTVGMHPLASLTPSSFLNTSPRSRRAAHKGSFSFALSTPSTKVLSLPPSPSVHLIYLGVSFLAHVLYGRYQRTHLVEL